MVQIIPVGHASNRCDEGLSGESGVSAVALRGTAQDWIEVHDRALTLWASGTDHGLGLSQNVGSDRSPGLDPPGVYDFLG